MKVLGTLVGLGCLSSQVVAMREGDIIEEHLGKRTAVGTGCNWCSVGPWKIDPACSTYEYSAVASSMNNPPSTIKFDATSFCSEFLRPLRTKVEVVSVTSHITTSTSTYISIVTFKSTSTSAIPSPTTTPTIPQTPAPSIPIPTPKPTSKPGAAAVLKKRNFTVPDYLEDWYYYGRLDPGCSCLITSAMPSVLLSATETTTAYDITVSTTVTEVYTIYPDT